MNNNIITIPPDWMNIAYNGKIIPNGKPHDMLISGANCQVFAFALLRRYGLKVPDFRSSELWADGEYSTVIQNDYLPLDILFFHKREEAYGAHIAVYIGNGQAIHLSKRVGKPMIWDVNHFFEYTEYQFLLGGKRFFRL